MLKYHYVYRITNTQENKHYYGVRTSKIEPKLDLGIKYFSSSSDNQFIIDQKETPHLFKYKIVRILDTRKEATGLEIKLHSKFNVGVNESFYNKAKQTSTGFDMSGIRGKKHHKYGTKHNISTISLMIQNSSLRGCKAYTNLEDGSVRYFKEQPSTTWVHGNALIRGKPKDYLKDTRWVSENGICKRIHIDDIGDDTILRRQFNNNGFSKINDEGWIKVLDLTSLKQLLIPSEDIDAPGKYYTEHSMKIDNILLYTYNRVLFASYDAFFTYTRLNNLYTPPRNYDIDKIVTPHFNMKTADNLDGISTLRELGYGKIDMRILKSGNIKLTDYIIYRNKGDK